MHSLLRSNSSKLILSLFVCTALSACQTSQSVQDANLRASSIDQAMAQSYNYARKPTKSVPFLERLYKQNPDDEETAVDYAMALREQGQLDRARIILEPFARANPPSSLSTAEFAAIQLADGQYEAAEKFAQKSVIADENNFRAFHLLGIALDAQGLHEEAERAYRKGLNLWQGDPTSIMNNLALNLASQGYLDESIEILNKAMEVAPGRREIERNLRIVTALKQADGYPVPKPNKKPSYTPPAAPEPQEQEESAVEMKEPVKAAKVETQEPALIDEPTILIEDSADVEEAPEDKS